MPRLRVIKKANESANIPEDQPIQVEVGQEAESSETLETLETKKAKEDEAAKALAKQRQEENDAENSDLKKQLEDLKKAAEDAKAQAQRAAEDSQRQQREFTEKYERELAAAGGRAEQAELDAVLNALSAAESEAASAQAAWENANARAMAEQAAGNMPGMEAANKAASEANRRLSRAETRIVQLEDGKVAIEARQEKMAREAKERASRPAPAPTVEGYIDGLQGMMPSQKTWLKSHPELITDAKKNLRVQNAHLDAEEKGITIGSDAYFQFLDEKLGYKQPESETDEDTEDEPKPRKELVVAAPVTRDNPSTTGRTTPSRITLSPAQREAARAAGISEVEYARQLIKLQEAKREGRYGEH